jgi:BirA family biotin operon repressor/biotin-[acetyl-CoA-carboxylase] ligase
VASPPRSRVRELSTYLRDLGPAGALDRVVAARIDSTNLLARRAVAAYLAEEGEPPAFLVLALEQSAGRGRQGRAWSSPAGRGVYATRVLAVRSHEELRTLPLLVAVGLAVGLDDLIGSGRCRLKWPNDLLVGGRKIGGILIEAMPLGPRAWIALAGFGVNHAPAAVSGWPEGATSLAEEAGGGAPLPPLGEVARRLLAAVEAELGHLGETAYAGQAYRDLSAHRTGDRLRCRTGDGVLAGTVLGFDDGGLLRLEVDGREVLLGAAEVVEDNGRPHPGGDAE